MNEQIEKLVRMAIDAGASVDITYEAGGDRRVNIYPQAITVGEALTFADVDSFEGAITGALAQRLPGQA